ncbi:MAG: hypothetical protein WBA05_00605 [Gordonia sp. (in: high G+C Gram-positive bacteria)]|uniref:hypothetical protein n=1 Tax=Gordonia TaxID=2053 RepID=UPI003267117B
MTDIELDVFSTWSPIVDPATHVAVKSVVVVAADAGAAATTIAPAMSAEQLATASTRPVDFLIRDSFTRWMAKFAIQVSQNPAPRTRRRVILGTESVNTGESSFD